jgi:tetratricopeptide (TPR) repeat protein
MSSPVTPNLDDNVSAEATAELARAAAEAGDLDQAMRLADEAVARGLSHPLLFNLAAHVRETRHQYAEAIELLKRGLELDPNELSMLTAMGLCFNKLRQPQRALAAFDAVLAAVPHYAPAHYGRGAAFTQMGDFDAARRHLITASRLPPVYADPIGSLAQLEARLGDMTSARTYAERALALDPTNIAARTALAVCETEAGSFERAEALTRSIVDDASVADDGRASAGIALGDALNGQGRVDEAMAAYAESKALSRRLNAPELDRPGEETYPQFLDRLRTWISTLPPDQWRPSNPKDESGAAGHLIIMGFARSGTTLLETALAGHPAVVSLDERDSLRKAGAEALKSSESLAGLATLDEAAAERMRSVYWARVAEHGANVKGKVFVDKAPFAAGLWPLIAALFPTARILFAIRDPRDVVLSCFRRDFLINPTTFQFTTIESTARCYDSLMRVAMLARDKLPLATYDLYYERLTHDFEGEASRVCEFLNLEWREELADIAGTARSRPSRTPSARQLARGLYRGEGQWRPYARHLEPVMPILQPWIERFGYA